MERMYSVTFSDIAVTVVQDFFQLEANTVPVVIHGVYISQRSDVGDAAAESLLIQVSKVTDAVTDDLATVQRDPGDATQLADVAINETTQLSTGKEVYHAECWNIAMTWIYLPTPEMRPIAKVGDVIVIGLETAPTDSLTVSGTIYFTEEGA